MRNTSKKDEAIHVASNSSYIMVDVCSRKRLKISLNDQSQLFGPQKAATLLSFRFNCLLFVKRDNKLVSTPNNIFK